MRESLKDLFIPHQGNNHKPHVLHHHSLTVIAIVLVLVKAVISLGFFFIYPSRARMSQELTQQILLLTNTERADNQLASLTLNPELSRAAQLKAQDMLDNNYFAHQSPNGSWPWDWIDRQSYPYIFAGENLAMYFSSAQSAHSALMMSQSHRENILAKKYTDLGLAIVNGIKDDKPTNILVEFFGARQESSDNSTKLTSANEPRLPPSSDKEKIIIEQIGFSGATRSDTLVLNTSTSTPPTNRLPKFHLPPSPNAELITAGATQILVPAVQDSGLLNLLSKAARVSENFFISMLIFLGVALGLNIFIRAEVQHKPVILRTCLVIFLAIGLISIRFHFLETMFEQIAIL